MFEQVFSEEEMEDNPLVQRLQQRLALRLDHLQAAANDDPSAKFLFFVIPIIALAALAYTAFGVAPGFVGLLGLFIPALIFVTMTDVGGGQEARNAGSTSSGRHSGIWPDLQFFLQKLVVNDLVESEHQQFERNILLFKGKYHAI